MRFLRENADVAMAVICERLATELQTNKRVLWLVCGGSNIPAEAEILRRLKDAVGGDLKGLAILPTDERYGPPGHPDSNFRQLQETGFEPGNATWVDVLTHDVPLAETISFYSEVAATAFANADVVIAVFGMGANAHIAGIQPESPAVAPGAASVVGFEWEDFTRLTLTAEMIKQIDIAYAMVYGDKSDALERLERKEEPFEKVPAKILYQIPEVYVYNDHIESEG
jgi:6-phosphogluconolactonase/glucosamine-6-phosphate isomerase/deaminase